MQCSKCNSSGLIPFEKNGKLIPNVFVHCECYAEPQEYYHPVSTEDFDFPMSDTFRGASYQYCNQYDPGFIPPRPPEPEPPPPQIIEHRHSDMSKANYDLLQQTMCKVNYLESKLNEREKWKRPRGEY